MNGILWDLFHFFYHSNGTSVVAYLLPTVPLAFAAQRTRSTWPGIIAHIVANRAALTMLWGTVPG